MIKEPGRTEITQLDEKITRLVVLGDPHGGHAKLKACIEREDSPTTQFVSLGDNIGYKGSVDSALVCRILREWGIPSVRGNHEEWIGPSGKMFMVTDPKAGWLLNAEMTAWCKSLPYRIIFKSPRLPGRNIFVQHAFCSEYEDWLFMNDIELSNVFLWKPEFSQNDVVYNTYRKKWVYTDDAKREMAIGTASADRFISPGTASILFMGHNHRPALFEQSTAGGSVRREWFDSSVDVAESYTVEPNGRYIVDAGSIGRPEYMDRNSPNGWAKAWEAGSYAVLDFGIATPTVTFKTVRISGG